MGINSENKWVIYGFAAGVIALTVGELNPVISEKIGLHAHQDYVIYVSTSPAVVNSATSGTVTTSPGIAYITLDRDGS